MYAIAFSSFSGLPNEESNQGEELWYLMDTYLIT